MGWSASAMSKNSETVAAADGLVIELTIGFFTSIKLIEARVVKNCCLGFFSVNHNKDDELARLSTLAFGSLFRAANLLSCWCVTIRCQAFSNVNHKKDDELTQELWDLGF